MTEPERNIWDVLKDFVDGFDGCVQEGDDPVLYGELRLSHVAAAADRISELEGRLSLYESDDDNDEG